MFNTKSKLLSLFLLTILLLSFSFFFVACGKKKEDTTNHPNTIPDSEDTTHHPNTIPDSNVYEDLVEYIKSNGQLDNQGRHNVFIIGDPNNNTTSNIVALGYDTANNVLGIAAIEKNIGGFILNLSKNIDYSKNNHSMTLYYALDSQYKTTTITIPATKFIDMHTTIELSKIAVFNESSSLTEEEKNICFAFTSPKVAEGLMEFSKFYANTIKQNSQYLGATYKYFYLPVIA